MRSPDFHGSSSKKITRSHIKNIPICNISLRLAIASLLIATASIKVLHGTKILASDGLLSTHLNISLAVAFEVSAAIVVVSAPCRIARIFTISVFCSLAIVATWAFWSESSCGCFGAHTPRGAPVLVDLSVIALAILLWRPSSPNHEPHERRWKRFRLSLFTSIVAGTCVGSCTYLQLNKQYFVNSNAPTWFGHNLIGEISPMLSDPNFADRVPVSGDALVVLLRPDCQHCKDFSNEWPAASGQMPAGVLITGISILGEQWLIMPDVISATPVYSDRSFVLEWSGRKPFVSTPTVLIIHDRIVRHVLRGDDSRKFFETSETRPPFF